MLLQGKEGLVRMRIDVRDPQGLEVSRKKHEVLTKSIYRSKKAMVTVFVSPPPPDIYGSCICESKM